MNQRYTLRFKNQTPQQDILTVQHFILENGGGVMYVDNHQRAWGNYNATMDSQTAKRIQRTQCIDMVCPFKQSFQG